jgi:Zinc-binding dehydrogenase
VIQKLGGADAAIALAVAPRPFEQAFDSLARGGTLMMVALPEDNYVKLPIFETVLRGINIKGSIVGTHRDVEDVFKLHTLGRTRAPRVSPARGGQRGVRRRRARAQQVAARDPHRLSLAPIYVTGHRYPDTDSVASDDGEGAAGPRADRRRRRGARGGDDEARLARPYIGESREASRLGVPTAVGAIVDVFDGTSCPARTPE